MKFEVESCIVDCHGHEWHVQLDKDLERVPRRGEVIAAKSPVVVPYQFDRLLVERVEECVGGYRECVKLICSPIQRGC